MELIKRIQQLKEIQRNFSIYIKKPINKRITMTERSKYRSRWKEIMNQN